MLQQLIADICRCCATVIILSITTIVLIDNINVVLNVNSVMALVVSVFCHLFDPCYCHQLLQSAAMLLGQPSTAWPQTVSYRPGSALKPQSVFRPPTAAGRSACRASTPDSGRPSTSSRPVSTLSMGEQKSYKKLFSSLLRSSGLTIKAGSLTSLC